eukprot:1630195-Amphidinium_carterae.2
MSVVVKLLRASGSFGDEHSVQPLPRLFATLPVGWPTANFWRYRFPCLGISLRTDVLHALQFSWLIQGKKRQMSIVRIALGYHTFMLAEPWSLDRAQFTAEGFQGSTLVNTKNMTGYRQAGYLSLRRKNIGLSGL